MRGLAYWALAFCFGLPAAQGAFPHSILGTVAMWSADGVVADGAYWKQVTTLRSSAEGVVRLQIAARGRVRVRGERGMRGISVTLTKRVKAPNMMAAKVRLDSVLVAIQNQGSNQGSNQGPNQGPVVMVDVVAPDGELPELTLELTVPRALKQTSIQTRTGDVEATELDGTVFVESGGGMVRLDAIGQDVIARTAGGEMRLGRVGGSLNCGTGGGTIRVDTIGGNAEFSTGGGEIWVREAKGWLRASTAGGSIHVERAAGEVVANSGGGVIEVAQAGGAVSASTAGGTIEVAGGHGVQCESGAGSIRLKGVEGRVRAVTAKGMILAEVRPGATMGNSLLAAKEGDIILYLPSNLAVTVRARTELGEGAGEGLAGKIVSEFGELQGRRDRWRGMIAEGRLNGGGPLLDLVTSGGAIHLRRLKP